MATNAHVTEGLREVFRGRNPVAGVVQHEIGTAAAITHVWTHPAYDADSLTPTPDVGLLRVDRTIPAFLDLAAVDSVQQLSVFDDVSLCGFPTDVLVGVDLIGLLTGSFHPRATCLRGTISALRPLDPTVSATPANRLLIQYDLPVVPGTSGSAVFNPEGQVIGINAIGLRSDGDFNFAIRGDALSDLIAWSQDGTVSGTLLEPAQPAVCETSYYNNDWGVGFDVPSGFIEVLPDLDVTSARFVLRTPLSVAEQLLSIELWTFEIEASLASWLVDWIELESTRYELIQSRPFETSNGSAGTLLVWRQIAQSGSITVAGIYTEAWIRGSRGVYTVRTTIYLPDSTNRQPAMEAVALSVCVD